MALTRVMAHDTLSSCQLRPIGQGHPHNPQSSCAFEISVACPRFDGYEGIRFLPNLQLSKYWQCPISYLE